MRIVQLAAAVALATLLSGPAAAAPPGSGVGSIWGARSNSKCTNTSPSTLCEVSGTANSSGIITGSAYYEPFHAVAGSDDPYLGTVGQGFGGGYVWASHSVPRGARSVTYTATYEVAPYDDPSTATIEARGLTASGSLPGSAGYAHAMLAVQPPGCDDTSCHVVTQEDLADSRADTLDVPSSLEVGQRRSISTTVTAATGTSLKKGTAIIYPEFYGVGLAFQAPGVAPAGGSGAVRVVSITAEVK